MSAEALVYLIGAGPGDPGLFTLKGVDCLKKADVVVYDYLANQRLLEYARPDAELLFVGKKGFSEHVTQDEINALIVEKALEEGVEVLARLKGGDPFVFGRGGEEALALAEQGIAFEVVPGVTAGVAAPAYAGIPVTHRGIASSVAFVTGHEDPTKDASAIDWEYLARGVDTLCFYMGIKSLPLISERLIAHGRSEGTPVALVRWGTTPRQETLVSTLENVAEDAAQANFQAPAIILVGEVATLRQEIAWFEQARPLLGKSIVVTRSRTQASALSDVLAAKGAQVLEFPTIQIDPPSSYEALDASIEALSQYDWVIFTSVNGVQSFFERLDLQGKDARVFAEARVAAIGPATADALGARGIHADIVPSEYKAEGVLEALFDAGVAAGDRVLIPRARVARDVLPETLRSKGIAVEVVEAYETKLADAAKAESFAERLRTNEVDMITFASSSTVKNFVALMRPYFTEDELKQVLADVSLASIGPITTETIKDEGLDVSLEAQDYTIKGLVAAIEQWYGKEDQQ